MRWCAYACFGGALALVVITCVMMLPQAQKSFEYLLVTFEAIEKFIAQYENFSAFFLLMFIFLVKSYLNIIPFSVLFIASGMVFNENLTFLINILGFFIFCLPMFWLGKKRGGGGVHKVVNRSETIYKFMDFGGKGNKWMLVLLRFIPIFPQTLVSRAYGGTDMKTRHFLWYSLLGFLPRLILWSLVGVNIFNPFTVEFMAPIIILLIISGISLLLLNVILTKIRKDTENDNK